MKTQIVVVGGGAGGLALVRRLRAKLGREAFDVILIEQNHTHIWKPLLHEVAAGSLDANLDEIGYRSHGPRWGYRFFYGSLESVDRAARQVVIAPILDEDGSELIGRHCVRYDYLVIAIGSVSNDFGTPGVKENCLFLENRIQADRFRLKLLNHCLRVSRTMSAAPSSEAFVDIAIVGAGATGVELAAELYNSASALKHYGLEVFDESRLRVSLIEAGPRILPALPDAVAAAAHKELEILGVRVLPNTVVKEATATGMRTGSGEEIRSDISVWAAGVRGPDILRHMDGLEVVPSGQLAVLPTLQTTYDERVFALGDCCFLRQVGQERPVPPRAQAAHQMASTVYRNILSLLAKEPLEQFVYRDRGSLVSLSRFSTVGNLMGSLVGGRMAVEGRLARMVYMSLYRMHLLAIHGWIKGLALILVGHVNQVVRPRLKLH
ncbi:MAG: NAD(P)/FAD-dependent oxidoreductase [Mesorhizobium sp.]|uniref:NAD(P)/FAD-dependent oxidoreductase n=1 Tax=Mesorhizobium sp. TaxID=1871066 RepID=UPI001AC0F0F2|nr:NAD(P)/FAD-dependent oxidoreductase [Mesorhizobium sp.]MBN9217290.1 NAD(P)/FAD-dependent oxidoreductase [Mesorhizobium sp.]